MKSNITKSAAAAIILVGAFIFLTTNGTSIAWADVVEQLNLHGKYKCRQRVVRKDGHQIPTKDIYHMNLSLRRQEVEDGTIQIIDMRKTDAVTLELDPDKKKAVMTKLLGFGPKKDPDIIDMVKRYEQESVEKLGTKKKDGKVLQGFRHLPNEHNDFTVWVDPKTKLPVEIELKHLRDGKLRQTIFMDEFEFDFQLDPSAFSTEVPEGYTVETLVNDYRPFESTEVTFEEIQNELNHTAYALKSLPWMEKIVTIKNTDPLGSKIIVYMTGIKTGDGNVIVIAQGNYYDTTRMVWIPQQELILETPDGIKIYTHPNGSIYAKHFLESFKKAVPELAFQKLHKERFTRMIVMPDGAVLSISANRKISEEQLRELIESLSESVERPEAFIPHSCTETVYRDGKETSKKKMFNKTLSVRRQEHFDDGMIAIIDMSGRPVTILQMEPDTHNATLTRIHNKGPMKNPDEFAMLAQMRQGGAEKLGVQVINGIEAEGFRTVSPHNDITIWEDVKTGLPVKVEIVHPKRNQKIVTDQYDFTTELDDSLFLTTPPEGYELTQKDKGLNK